MSKQYFFFKNLVRGALDDNTFFTLWELLESWISQNNWMAIFFIIFLGIIFEIALIKIYTSFKKTPALSEESSNPEESEDGDLQNMTFDNYSSHSSSEERVDQFSGRTISSSLLSEENEGNFENTVPLAEEMMWAGTCDSRYQVSHLSESYMSSSNGSNSPLFHSEIKEVFVRQGGSSGNEEQTVQYSSKKLFSIMKTNKNKTVMFSSDFNFSRTSRISSETEDPDVAPCPPAHLFLSRDQVRLLEENVRQQIPLKSKATLEKKVTNLSSRSQESLVQNHHPAQMNIFAQTQDSPGENVNQNQSFYDAQLICQPQQFVYNQQVISCQHDTEVRSFALPQNLVRRPQSSSTQESIHAQVVDRSEHLVQDPCSVKTQDSVKSTESDKHFDEAQCSVRRRDSDKKEESLWKQNNVLKNARHLDLTLTPNPVTHRMPQLERMKTKVQEQIASSDSNQYSVSDPTPVLPERQKIQRKISHSKSKFSPKVPSEKPKKAASSQAHQNTGYRMSKHRKLGCNYNTKKMKELYQRKETSGKPLSLTCVSKLFVPYIKKYSRKNLVEVMSSLNIYTDFLLKQDKSLDAEVDKAGSIEERGASSDTENIKQQSRDNKGLKTTAPKISPQVEQSFTVNTFQLEVSCSSSVEINWKNKESLKGPVIQGKGIGIAEFFQALKSKGTCDLCTPKHQTLLAETVSEPMQDFVSSPNMKSNRSLKTKEELRSTEEPRPPLSDTEKVPTNPPERSFPKGNTHCKALRIVLESPDANLLISLETKKHDSSERPAGIDMQEGTGEVIWKKETPFSLHITGCSDLNESEGLEYSRASTRDEVSGAPLRTAHTATSGQPDREVLSRLRAKTEASSIVDATLSAVRQEELPDEKMAENTEEKCRSKKPHRHDKEEEEQALREAALEQTEDFRFSLELKLQSKPVQFEIEQISSGKRQTPSEEWAAQTQTVSTQTIWETSPRPRVGLCQAEKQRADSPTDTEDAGPQNPPQPEELPVGASSVQTFGSCVPSSNDPKKIPGHIAEEKQDIRASPVVASGSWVSHVLHSSYLKSQEIRKVLSGTHSAFRPQCVVMKAKEPTLLLTAPSSRLGISSYRKRCRKSIIKNQKPQDETVTDVLLNATYPHRSTSPHSRLPSGVNTENHSLTKLTHEKSQVEREEQCSDFVIKGDDAGCRSDAKLHDEVRGGETVPPQTAPSAHRDPHMELPTEKERQWPGPAAEAPVAPPYSPDREPALREKGRLETHGRFRCAAVSKVTPSPGASRAGNALKQTREHDGPGYENDLGHFFVEKDLSEDSAAASPGTFSCHIPILCYSKGRKHRESFSHGQCKERSKSVHVKTGKPSMPRILSITGHGRKLESNFKTKCEKIILADRLVHGFLHTLYSPGPGRLQRDRFGHPQLLRGELAVSERRPPCADAPAYVQDAFSDREEKVKDGKEKEQNAVPEAAPQRARSLQPSADQRETHMGQPDPARRCLMWEPPVREQDARRGARFPETAAHPGLWPGPSKAQDIEKTDKTGSGLTAHLGAEILPPRSGTASSDQRLNTAPGCGSPLGGTPAEGCDSYFVEASSELLKDLQVALLQSSHSAKTYVSEHKGKRSPLKLARQPVMASCSYGTRREERLHVSHTLGDRQSQGQQRRREMEHTGQGRHSADVFSDSAHAKAPLLVNGKMSRGLDGGREMQRVTRLGHAQEMRERSPKGRHAGCPPSAELTRLSVSVKEGKEVAREHAGLPAPEASQDFLSDACQKEDQAPTEWEEELKRSGNTHSQVQPQTHLTPAILGSASSPLFYPFQQRELEGPVRSSPSEPRAAKTGGIAPPAGECGSPSGTRHQKEPRPGGAAQEEAVTLDFYEAASATPRRKRNFKQYSDLRTLVSSPQGMRKANKPSVVRILSAREGASSHRGEEPGRDPSPSVEEMDPGKKMAASVSPIMARVPDSGTYGHTRRKKDMSGAERLISQRVKQMATALGGTVPADETKEASHPDEEEEGELESFLRDIPQHSQHFIFCSGQTKEFEPRESADEGRTAPQLQAQAEGPKPDHQTHVDALCAARSQLQLLKSKESLAGQVLIATLKYGLGRDGSREGTVDRDGNGDRAGAQKGQQAAVLESADVPTSALPAPDRPRKVFILRALRRKANSRGVVLKARKAPVSQTLRISGNACPKHLPPKILKSHISGSLVHRRYSGVPEGKGLAQGLLTSVLESWDLSTPTLPVSKRKRNSFKRSNKMSPTCVTRTLKITRPGAAHHRQQFEHNLNSMLKHGQSVADVILNAISSIIAASPDMHHRTEVEADSLGEMGVLQQAHPVGGARAEARERARASSRHLDGEASGQESQHLRLDLRRVKAPGSVMSDLELENPVGKHSLESPGAAQEPPGQAPSTPGVVHYGWRCKSTADAFSSPTYVARDTKIDSEVQSSLKTEVEKPRANTHSQTPPELERPACAWGARKAGPTDTQTTPSNTTHRKEPREKEEDDALTTSPAPGPHTSQHPGARPLCVADLGPYSLEGRGTWNLSCMVRKLNQEKHICETIWKPVSRHVLHVLQVKTAKERPQTQEGEGGRAQPRAPPPDAGTSGAGPAQGQSPQDRDPRRARQGPAAEQMAWNQNYLLRMAFRAFGSSELKSQDDARGRAGRKGLSPSPGRGPWPAGDLPTPRLLLTSRARPGSHGKRQRHPLKRKARQRQGHVGAFLLWNMGGARVLTAASVTDRRLLAAVAQGNSHHRAGGEYPGGLTTEEKTEVGGTLATTCLGPSGLCMPSLSDSKSQQDTGQLPGKKILLASTCLTVEKKPPTSHVFKVEQRFPTKCREKHRCNLKIKMKETQPSRNVAETVSSAREAADPQRQSGHSTELDRRLCPVEGLVLARWLSTLCIPEEQEQTADKAGDGRALSAGLKSARAAVPVPAPTQTEPAPGTPWLCADASGKERALHKAKPRKKERCARQPLLRTTSRSIPPFEFGPAQGRQSGPSTSEALLITAEGLTPQETESGLTGQEAEAGVAGEFSPEPSPYSSMHLPASERREKEPEAASGRKEHSRESPGEARPASNLHFPMDGIQIKLPWETSRESPADQAPSARGAGLLPMEKAGRLAQTDRTSAKSACRSSRELLQGKMARRTRALEEVVRTVDYTPVARGIGSLIIGGRGQREKCVREVLLKPASGSKAGLLRCHTPAQQATLAGAVMVSWEPALPQRKRVLKGVNVTFGCTQKHAKTQPFPNPRQQQQHPLVPAEALPEHLSYPQNDSWLLPHLMALTKKMLADMSSAASSTKALALSNGHQEKAAWEGKAEGAMSSRPEVQMKTQKARLPLGPSEVIEPLNVWFPNGKKSLDEAQEMDAVPKGGPPREGRRKKLRSRTGGEEAHSEVRLLGLFVHSLSLGLPALSESSRQKGGVNPGLKKALFGPRTWRRRPLELTKAGLAHALNAPGSPGPGPLWGLKEKPGRMAHSKLDLVVTNIYEFTPLSPHPRRNQATASERISNNGKRTRQHTVPEKKDRIKGVKLTLPPNGRELPVLLCTIRQESQAQGRGRNSDVGTRALRSGLPPLPRPHLNTRTQVRGGEPSRARGCLPLPSFRALSNTGKTSFAESVHRESLSSVIESKPHCAPRKKAGRENAAQANGITPRGVSATMRICEEPTDDILSSIVKAKYRPQKGGVEMSLEEMWCRGVAWKARRPASAHHSPWRLTEQQRKTLRETRGSLRIQSKSCPSISFLPYLDMIRRRKVKRRDSKSCYLQAQIQKSSDTGKIAWKRPLHVDTPQSTQKAKEHIIQEHEKTETAKALPLKKNTSSGAQEIQWSIQEQEEKAEKVTSTPRVVLTNTRTRSPAASHLQLDPSIEKVGCVIEITKYSLPKGSHRGRNAAKKANEDPSRGGISSSVQEATVCPPREEASVQLPAKEDPSHPEDQGLQHREAPPQGLLPSSPEPDGRGPGGAGQGRPGGTGGGEQGAGLPPALASQSPLAHYEPGRRAGGKEDVGEVTGPALAQGQPQQPPGGGERAPAKPAGDDSGHIKRAQEHRPQKAEARGATDDITSVTHPQGATSRPKILPLPPALRSPEGPAPPVGAQRNTQDRGGHVWGRKGEPDGVPTPPPAQLEVSKGVGGQGGHRGRARPAGPPSWHRKSTDAVSPWLATPRDWERAEDLAQERQGDARVLEGAVARPTSVALRAKPAPLPRILETETLHVSVTEPVTGGLAGGRVEVVVLSKICPFLAFSTDLHLDTINEDTGGPGASSAASHRGLPESPEYPPPGQTVPAAPVAGRAQSGDRRPEKGKRPALPHGDGAHFQAGASRPPPVLSASEHCALTKGKKAEGVGEKAEQEPARAEEPHVLLTQAPAAPCPARQRVAVSREAWVANTRFSVSSELPKPSGAGETRNAGPREGISSCDWTVKAIRCLSYEKAKDGDKIKEEKGGMVSRAMSWRAERAPSSRQPSRVPPTGKEPDKGILSRGGKAGGLPAESGASFPPPSSLNRDTGVEERDLLGPAKGYFPPMKIQDPCSVGLRAGVKSSDCSVLKGKDRRQADVEEKILPGHVDLKARKFSLTHALRARALQWGSEERERTMQEDKTPVVGLDSICASLATLPYFKCDITGERYTLRIAKLPLSQPPFKPSSDAEKTARPPATGAEASSDLQEPGEHPLQKEEKGREENTGRRHTAEPRGAGPRARKPPVSLTWSRSTLQTSEEPEGRVPAAEREPGRVVPAHTCASGARPLPLPGSPGMELGGGLGPTRPCSSCTSFQESSEAGRVEQAEPETGDTSVPPHQGEGCAPQSRAGEGKGLLLPRPPRKKTRKCQAEAGVVLTTPSSRLSSPHLKVDKGTQVEADLPSPGRTTEAGEGVPSEPARGSATRAVQNEERREPQKERGGERAAHRRGVTHCTRVTLRSTELPRSAVLHRTELHLHIPPRRQTQHQGPGKAPGPAPTLVCVSRPPPRSLLSGNGTQAGHERPGVRRPPPRAPSPPAWPDAEPSAGPEARGGDVREGRRQPQAQCHLRTVAVNIRVRCRQAGAAPVSRILGAKALMLNVNVLTGSRHTGDPEPRAFLTRAFLCTPAAASLDLELGSRVNAAAARLTGASGPQRTLPESPRAQKAEPGEAADGHRELGAESGEPSGRGREAPRRWASDFLICLRGGERPPQVTSRGDARQLAVDSQDEEVYLTGFGTLSIGRRLECLFTGQEAQSGKYGTEARSTLHPCPATEPTSGQKRAEEAAAERDSGHRARAEGPPSQPRGDPGSGSPVGSRPRPRPEPNAQPQGSLPKAALGPADSGSGPHTPEAEGHRDSRVRTSPRGSPEDAKAAEARGAPQKERSAPEKEGPTVLADTAQQPRGGGPQPGRKASRPLTWPPPNGTQNTPPRTDACEQMSLCPGARLLPGTQVGGTALGRVSRGCGQRWSASELQASALTRLQDLLTPCWAFSLPGAGQVGETEGGTRSLPHLERKPVKTGKGKFKQGAPVAGRLQEENPGEVSLKEEKLRKGRSQKAPARQAAKPPAQTQTQALARLGKGCAGKQNHGQEQGGPPASPGAQPPVLLPRQVLDSFYAYVPLPPKFEGWRGRVTVADLKRELSPEYLAVKIPHHPVPQILGDLGRGAPGHRMRLEYDFTKPQVFLWHGGASAIAIRSLSVAMLRPPQMKDMKASERKQRRGQRVGLSEAPGRPASTREATWGRGGCSSIMEAGGPGAPGSTPQESQPFPVPEWRMQKPPGVRSEASRESGSPVTPQTEDRAAPGHGLLTRTEEPGSLATEQEEKAPESIPTPTESPFPAEAARERPRSCVQSTQSLSLPPPSEAAPGGSPLGHISGCTSPPEPCLPGPTPDSGTSKVQSPRSFPEPVPAPYQVASNKAERVARAPAAGENLAPLFEAIKNMLESQMERMIQDKVCAEVLKQVRAHSAGAREPPSSAELDPTFRARPEGRPEAVLDRVTAREKRKLTGDLKSKARERKGNLIPARVRQSSQKFSRHPEGLLLGDSGGRWRPGRPGLPAAGGPDTATELSLGHRSPGEATANRVRNLTGGDARGSTKILTMLRSVPPPPRRAFSAPFVEERPLAHVLQKLSIQERERLLVHFSMRTLAMQVKSLPRMVEDSHAMASAQDQRRPPSRCICPAVREPNRQKRIVLLFEEKSLRQIDLDLQYKYQRFLLGLPEERTFPKSKACPRCSPRPNPAARGREVDCGGESARLCAGAAASGKHFSFKEQSPPEQAASIRKVLELAPKHASDPGCPSTAQTDRAIPPKVKFTVTSEKEKKCHVWFQETDACNPFASKLLTAAPRGVDACPAQLAEGCADGLKAMGNPTDLDECPSREVRENEECAFGEVNRCLRREARHTPRGAQKGTPLQRLPRVEKSKSSLPSEAWASCHIRGSKKHTSSGTPPSCGSRQSKTSAPHGLCGGSLNTRHSDSVTSGPSSSSFCEGELCPPTRSETSHSLFPLTKSNIKLHLAKSQSRLHRHSERKERKKARSGSQSTNPSQDCEPSAAHGKLSEEPHPRRRPGEARDDPAERCDRFLSRQPPAADTRAEEASLHSDRDQGPPFFYACVPADSLEIIPKTVRWAIPPEGLRKRNVRLPLVAKVSSSCDLFSSSKNLLESFMESFSLVPQN